MSDHKTQRAPHDGKRINLSERYEVHYWCEKFRVSPEELEKAVKDVGPTAEAVERQLKG